jgi:hypothetical protein
MVRAVQTAWNANRHLLAAGFLAFTSLFLLLMFVDWRNEQRGMAAQKATGLASNAWDPTSQWSQKSILPLSRSVDYAMLGGVPRDVRPVTVEPRLAPSGDHANRLVIRSGTLEIIATDRLQEAEQLRNLAPHLSGFVVSSKATGSDERMR